ncbi:hypothetical protein KIW84_022538 [Lathyrus oleraceus]|uniref:Retrovirus-related Pol polyprotein from transposon TNT 1-94-like beta-barrel domain-containing protein n=1 Tax=Pisum sativum TaxID=3888 RepID=A0A9D4YF61_PEA|nr:hypothetical protein KIW84_022538 [Pisum sativum]
MQKKGLAATWSEEDSESESEGESTKPVTALTSVCALEDNSSGDELTFDELALKVIDGLNGEISLLTAKLEQMTKSIRMLNKGTDTLEEILKVGQKSGIMSGLGFAKKSPSELKRSKAEVQKFKQKSQPMSQHQRTRMSNHQKKKFQRWRCHYCGRFGHIKPFCYRLHGYPNQTTHVRPKQKASKLNAPIKKQKWAENQTPQVRPKQQTSKLNLSLENQQCVAKLAHTSPRAPTRQDWYLDSGCSRHMTGMSNLLVDLQPHATKYVTFGDGAKGEVKGVGKLDCPGVPKLSNVLLVRGLTANLISISQLCDQGFNVKYTRGGCVVLNGYNQEVMRGARSKDNCYLWKSKDSLYSSKCPLAKGELEVKLGHGRLGQLHLKGMKKIISKGAIRGIPNLPVDKKTDCGKCLIESCESLSPIGHHTNGAVARDKQMKLMQTEYNVTQNVMTLDTTQFDNGRGKEGMCSSEKL